MSKVKNHIKAINDQISEAIAIENAECKMLLYLRITELEDEKVDAKDILGIIKAELLGRKRKEMLFDA